MTSFLAMCILGQVKPHTITGDVRIFTNFASKMLGGNRTVRVYLPPGYENSKSKYPVLYMQDAQNLFDEATSAFGAEWRADEAAEALIRSKTIDPLIIVAVDNGGEMRIDELTPVPGTGSMRKFGGAGLKYEKMLVTELKPWVDRQFRTFKDRSHTGVGGSSLGGLIALDAAAKFPKVFGVVSAFSPSIWWADRQILQTLDQSSWKIKPKIWIDIGTQEGNDSQTWNESQKGVAQADEILQRRGFIPGKNLFYYLDQGAKHSESFWARRFPIMLVCMYRR